MSQLVLLGNVLGTGEITLSAPETINNPTLVLPPNSNTLVLKSYFTTDTVTEVASNLYFTNARARSAFASVTSSNISEGTNLYLTNARIAANVALLNFKDFFDVDDTGLVAGNAIVWNGSQWLPGTVSAGAVSTANTVNFSTLAANANLVVSLNNLSTSNLAEDTNLYYTNARVISAITAGNTLNYSNGNITLTTSGVSAGVYGGGSNIAILTIDQFGRITSASNVSVTALSIAAAGSNSQIMYNNAGIFAGSSNFIYDGINIQVGSSGAVRLANILGGFAGLKAPATITSNINFRLPVSNTGNAELITDGSGNLDWGRSIQQMADSGMVEMANSISSAYTIRNGYNAFSVGNLTIQSTGNVTLPDGSVWAIY